MFEVFFFICLVILPDKIEVEDQFFEQPIRTVVERCVEHGIWSVLWSTSKHLSTISNYRNRNVSIINDAPTAEDSQFVFWMLIAGITISIFAFGLELLVGNYLGRI